MNFLEYKSQLRKKIRAELSGHYEIRTTEDCFVIAVNFSRVKSNDAFRYEEIQEITKWLEKNKDIFVLEGKSDYRICIKMINYEKYLAETQKQKATQYDKEIEKLEAKLKELYQLQKNEREVNRKKKKVAELQKQLKELGVEIK